MPKINMQNYYNKLPEFTKGVLDTLPTFYVALFISFFLDLTAGQMMSLALPYLILSWFVELWKTRYIYAKIEEAYTNGFEDGLKGEKENE